MFKRQQASSAAVIEATAGLDEFARSVVQLALSQVEAVGALAPFVYVDRSGTATAHPLTADAVQGSALVSLLDVTRSGMKSMGREVTRYALVWPGKMVVDGDPVDAVFLEYAGQGASSALVASVCHWRDPGDGELTTDMELHPLGTAVIRPDWS